jgi:Tfp pilus assembly protein PilF
MDEKALNQPALRASGARHKKERVVPTAQEQRQENVPGGLKAEATLARSIAELGIKLFNQGEYQKASDTLAEALRASETAGLWNDWAAAEVACGRHDEAQEGFRRALSLEADNGQAMVNLGVLLARSGREREAIPLLRRGAVHVDGSQRDSVNQLLASCCRKVASDVGREAKAAVRQAVAELRQTPVLLRTAPAATAAVVAPGRHDGRSKTPVVLEKYVLAQGPQALTLESSSVCNLRCVMCPQGRGLVHRPRHFPAALVDKLASYLPGVTFVQLHGIGEPLHSPAFWRFLDTLTTPEGAHIEVNSNMTVLTDDQIGKLLGSRLSLINVSLDAATPETYARIRGYDLNKVISNIRRFMSRRKAEGYAKPALFLNMTLMRENIEELEGFVELGHNLGVDGLQLWHMNAGEDYRLTKKDGWTFDYQQQRLSNYPRLSNEKIRAALARAERLGTTFKLNPSKTLFFEEA